MKRILRGQAAADDRLEKLSVHDCDCALGRDRERTWQALLRLRRSIRYASAKLGGESSLRSERSFQWLSCRVLLKVASVHSPGLNDTGGGKNLMADLRVRRPAQCYLVRTEATNGRER